MKITVAGVGYVGLSLAVLLAQNHEVTAITTTESKAEKLNKYISPIRDDEIERFFAEAEKGERKLHLHAATDRDAAYGSAELVIIATSTNYDDARHVFDTSAVEDAIERTLRVNPDALIVIKSTVPVGYTEYVRKRYGTGNILFSPEFLRDHYSSASSRSASNRAGNSARAGAVIFFIAPARQFAMSVAHIDTGPSAACACAPASPCSSAPYTAASYAGTP